MFMIDRSLTWNTLETGKSARFGFFLFGYQRQKERSKEKPSGKTFHPSMKGE